MLCFAGKFPELKIKLKSLFGLIKKIVWVVVFVLITACTSSAAVSSTTTPEKGLMEMTPAVLLPLQKDLNGERAVMEALIIGNLSLVDDCIRIENNETGASYLLIWPPDFSVSNENHQIIIKNSDGNIRLLIGDSVQLSGGEINLLSMLDEAIRNQLPPRCSGPYWMMGDEISVIEKNK